MKFARLLAQGWAGGWLGLVAAAGLLAPWLPLPYPPAAPDLAQQAVPPAWAGPHYLGTDPLGRDVLAGLVFGARQLLLLSVPAAALATGAGAVLGGAAGYWANRGLRVPGWAYALLLALLAGWLRPTGVGLAIAVGLVVGLAGAGLRPGWRRWPLPLDSLVLGSLTLLGTVPRLLLALALAAGPPLGGGWLLLLLALLAWPDSARLVRTQMRQTRHLPFVEAARALGLPAYRVWGRHALPAACRPLLALAPLTLAGLISLENTLAFLGVGGSVDAPGWGQLLKQFGQAPDAWWLLALPGGALFLTLLALQRLARQFHA